MRLSYILAYRRQSTRRFRPCGLPGNLANDGGDRPILCPVGWRARDVGFDAASTSRLRPRGTSFGQSSKLMAEIHGITSIAAAESAPSLPWEIVGREIWALIRLRYGRPNLAAHRLRNPDHEALVRSLANDRGDVRRSFSRPQRCSLHARNPAFDAAQAYACRQSAARHLNFDVSGPEATCLECSKRMAEIHGFPEISQMLLLVFLTHGIWLQCGSVYVHYSHFWP